VNAPIIRIYALILVLLALLVWKTSQWSVFDSAELKDNPQNRRPLIAEQTIRRGTIRTADGVVIALSQPQGGGKHPIYVRHYPQGSEYGNPVGYNFVQAGRAGIERSENGLLTGQENEFASLIDQLRGATQAGDDITLTIDSHVQQVATQALQQAISTTPGASGNGGAVVALDPTTGAVKAMVSLPGYDPNQVQNDISQLSQDSSAPLVNRPTQSTYPPGSTMKVVTAAAALDSGKFTPSTVLNGRSPQVIGGLPLSNAGDEQFGDIDMTTALTHSVNTYFGQVGERIGTGTMVEYMKRFGFYADPDLDLPDDEMRASGPYTASGRLTTSGFDVGRVAIGQGGAEGQILASPMQMAEVAATVANGGTLMQPTFLEKATDPDGRTVQEIDPTEEDQAISSQTASELTDMMTKVTEEGTAAGLTVGGQSFAGKTGTAEIGDPAAGTNQPWFIAFAPVDAPKIAVAVTLERCQGCFGGDTAGPVATQVMEAALGQ
jgi:peptidoglycan glycosyltransferase